MLFSILNLIPALSFSQIQGGCTLSNLNSNNGNTQRELRLSTTTGNANLDQVINLDMYSLYDLFDVRANIYMYSDNEGPNAMASPSVSDIRFPNGTVLLGSNLLIKEFENSQTKLLFSIPAILAHEMGHILQFKLGSQLSVTQKELQADFLAGYYLRVRSSRIPAATLPEEAFKSFFDKGDYEFNNPNHHGTKEQRLAAIKAGYKCNAMDLDELYETSKVYATNALFGLALGEGNENELITFNQSGIQQIVDNLMKGSDAILGEKLPKRNKDCVCFSSRVELKNVFKEYFEVCSNHISYAAQLHESSRMTNEQAKGVINSWHKIITLALEGHNAVYKKDVNNSEITYSWIVDHESKRLAVSMSQSKISIDCYTYLFIFFHEN